MIWPTSKMIVPFGSLAGKCVYRLWPRSNRIRSSQILALSDLGFPIWLDEETLGQVETEDLMRICSVCETVFYHPIHLEFRYVEPSFRIVTLDPDHVLERGVITSPSVTNIIYGAIKEEEMRCCQGTDLITDFVSERICTLLQNNTVFKNYYLLTSPDEPSRGAAAKDYVLRQPFGAWGLTQRAYDSVDAFDFERMMNNG